MITYNVTICKYNKDLTKKWFVKVNYRDTKKNIAIIGKQYKGGVNAFHTLRERTAAIQALKEYYEDKLKSGWYPGCSEDNKEVDTLTFVQAIEFGLKSKLKKKLSPGTIKDYNNLMDHIKEAAVSCGKSDIDIKYIRRRDISIILDTYQSMRNASNHRYNIAKSYLSAVLSELKRYEYFEVNPVNNIDDLPVDESQGFIRPTSEELIIIRDHLDKVFKNFSTYWKMVYDTGMRMDELLNIKVADILETWEVNLSSENSKTNRSRRPVISKGFRDLMKAHIGDAPDHYYVFGTFLPNGGKQKREKYFCPAPFKIKRDTATKTWKRIVKGDLGLACDMYGSKHKGGDDKLLAGISLDAVRQQYGHESKYTTHIYVKELFNVNKREIEDKSPSL